MTWSSQEESCPHQGGTGLKPRGWVLQHHRHPLTIVGKMTRVAWVSSYHVPDGLKYLGIQRSVTGPPNSKRGSSDSQKIWSFPGERWRPCPFSVAKSSLKCFSIHVIRALVLLVCLLIQLLFLQSTGLTKTYIETHKQATIKTTRGGHHHTDQKETSVVAQMDPRHWSIAASSLPSVSCAESALNRLTARGRGSRQFFCRFSV